MSSNHDINALHQQLERERADREQTENSLRDRLEKTEQKLALLLGHIGHEMKTQLNTASGMAELLSRTKLDAQQQRQIASIHYASQSLLQLTKNVESIAKIEADKLDFEPTEIDLEKVLKLLQETFQARVQHKPVDVMVEIHHGVKTSILTDGRMVLQILTNLLSNAEKLTDKGEIGVEVKLPEQPDEESKIQFVVFDSGQGISPQQQAFFRSTKDEQSLDGIDLELWVANSLVNFLKGEIDVTSSAGTGTRFSVTLPVSFADSHPASETEVVDQPTKIIRTILVADENKMSRQYLKGIFEKYEVSAFIGEDGIDATTAAQQNAFDLILLDVHMQLMNGIEASASIRKNSTLNANTPIIGLATSVTSEMMDSANVAGMNQVITKPFTPENLIESLSKYGQFIEYNPNKVLAAKSGLRIAPNLVEEYYDGNQKMALKTIGVFLSTIETDIELLTAFSNSGKKSELVELVQKIQQSFASVGIPSLEEKFKGLEKEIPSLMPARLKKAISDVVGNIQVWMPVIKEYRTSLLA